MSNSVWKMINSKYYYLHHPQKLIKHIRRNLRWAWQRTIKGYCDGDWYDMDEWFCSVISDMLDDLANKGCAYPAKEPFETFERWHEWLHKMADQLRHCSERYSVNEYDELYHDTLHNKTKEDEAVKKAYWDRAKQLQEEMEELIKKTLSELAEHFYNLWD